MTAEQLARVAQFAERLGDLSTDLGVYVDTLLRGETIRVYVDGEDSSMNVEVAELGGPNGEAITYSVSAHTG